MHLIETFNSICSLIKFLAPLKSITHAIVLHYGGSDSVGNTQQQRLEEEEEGLNTVGLNK